MFMKVVSFSSRKYEQAAFEKCLPQFLDQEWVFIESHLNSQTAPLAQGADAVCVFVNDVVDENSIHCLAKMGVKTLALRSAGFNHVNLNAAKNHQMSVVRVPAYSPYAVAEHALALILTLNRKIHRAYNRVREGNFSLEGLTGFDMHGKTVGVVGTGKIGQVFCKILLGLGCQVLAYDPHPNSDLKQQGVQYVGLSSLWPQSDIVSLHLPLTPETHHLVNATILAQMKQGAMLVNTSRGALVDTQAVIQALKIQQLGALAIDVYEEEGDLFFEDLSNQVLQDDVFTRLLTFPNVLITGHQAFLTHEALHNIAETTLTNLAQLAKGQTCPNQL
jgi:D-lactate dehydrogenase